MVMSWTFAGHVRSNYTGKAIHHTEDTNRSVGEGWVDLEAGRVCMGREMGGGLGGGRPAGIDFPEVLLLAKAWCSFGLQFRKHGAKHFTAYLFFQGVAGCHRFRLG